jgi:hypothetical protein
LVRRARVSRRWGAGHGAMRLRRRLSSCRPAHANKR